MALLNKTSAPTPTQPPTPTVTELYKLYRPDTFGEIVGNQNTVAMLRADLENNRFKHTTMFVGPAGCGKTTLARISKSHLGCIGMDFIEVNAAIARGIDTVRDIAENMTRAPLGRSRVYLIDECHKLTNEAQNALLKITEDGAPPFVYFMFGTTNPEMVLDTLRSRCTTYEVKSLTISELTEVAKDIAAQAKLKLHADTILRVCEKADGGPRDMLVLLDQISALPPEQQVAAIAEATVEAAETKELCQALIQRKSWQFAADIIKRLKSDPESTRWAVLGYARKVLLDNTGETPKAKENRARAYIVISCFMNNFYDSKGAGLAYAAYEALTVNN
jgi:DNA polymerase III gamma/tau subunit